MFSNLGTTELVLIVIGIFLLFGAKKIPDLAKGIGKGIREFRREVKSDNQSAKEL